LSFEHFRSPPADFIKTATIIDFYKKYLSHLADW